MKHSTKNLTNGSTPLITHSQVSDPGPKDPLVKFLHKGIYVSKALTCMKFFVNKQNLLFIKEANAFGHIVV